MRKIITFFAGVLFFSFSANAYNTAQFDSDSVKIYRMDTAMFIPDGPYCIEGKPCLYSSILIKDFLDTDSIKDANEIFSICINIEHIFPSDLGIYLMCPNGKQVALMTFNRLNGGAWLGIPERSNHYRCDPRPPGIGWNYCWSEFYTDSTQGFIGPHTRPTYGPPIDSTNYKNKQGFFTPDTSFANFIGCPMNGEWKLVICDYRVQDNGWLFNWALELKSPCRLPQDFALESVGETNATFAYDDNAAYNFRLIYREFFDSVWTESASLTEILDLQPGTNYIAKLTCMGIDSPLDKSEGKTIDFRTVPLPPCMPISDLDVDLSETDTKFTLKSNPMNFKSWKITYKNADSSDTNMKTLYSATSTIIATDIDYHNIYEVKARSICEKNESIDTMFYVGGNYFPEKMHVEDITDTSASVHWTMNKTAGYYTFEYCKKEGIATKEDEIWIPKTEFRSPLTLSNLVPETTYRLSGVLYNKENGFIRTEDIEFTTLKRDSLHAWNIEILGNKITITPNPAKDFVTIHTKGLEGNMKIEVIDIRGKILQSSTIHCTGNQIEHKLMLNKLPAGVYSIRFTINNKSEIKKIVIQ